MDRVGSFGLSPDTDRERPALSGKESSLVDTVLTPDQMDANTAILLGATTEASGMSGAPTTSIPPFLVTVVTSEERTELAVSIIKECGGRV